MLAKIVNVRPIVPNIGALKLVTGKLTNTPDGIMVCYYVDLYTSRVTYNPEDLNNYLQLVSLPWLSDSQWAALDAPLTLEELQGVVRLFLPGTMGCP